MPRSHVTEVTKKRHRDAFYEFLEFELVKDWAKELKAEGTVVKMSERLRRPEPATPEPERIPKRKHKDATPAAGAKRLSGATNGDQAGHYWRLRLDALPTELLLGTLIILLSRFAAMQCSALLTRLLVFRELAILDNKSFGANSSCTHMPNCIKDLYKLKWKSEFFPPAAGSVHSSLTVLPLRNHLSPTPLDAPTTMGSNTEQNVQNRTYRISIETAEMTSEGYLLFQ
ncbi:hypothetical protein BDP27DRAFT_1360376 [Rhodocollybia butyracea]|uniref:Uncharacterized protein n=1 Tax=Rhodocollybia butyracea TaxID=206335 RepID=A0A9P5Q1X1_9AGAR|nr:hypothetical protein BDP27DRAFT_1360376 [Rhodocollybia butyracea]